jgi:hypothetical protein
LFAFDILLLGGIIMQTDMHYYGTLAMAVAAGLPQRDAETIAYSAQFTDDSTNYDSKEHDDHGFLYAISTAHHPHQSLLDSMKAPIQEGTEEQRKIWVPFHFLPGGEGGTLSEKLLCKKNSGIAKEMLENNLEASIKKPYGLELMGSTAHVYMDTFSHYGFSGIASSFNRVKNETIAFTKEPATGDYIRKKFNGFMEKLKAKGAQEASKSLGHAGVATYPDRPYLKYKFEFEKPRPENGPKSDRDNCANFLEGCKLLHEYFSKFTKKKYCYIESNRNFEEIEDAVKKVIAREADMEGRIKMWLDSGLVKGCAPYDPKIWEQEKMDFSKHQKSEKGISTNAYRFHQAATFHRYYVLKDLLPSHGIAVY